MREPTTPTGKAVMEDPWRHGMEFDSADTVRPIFARIEAEAAALVRDELMWAIDTNLQLGGLDAHAHAIFYSMLTNEDRILAGPEDTP